MENTNNSKSIQENLEVENLELKNDSNHRFVVVCVVLFLLFGVIISLLLENYNHNCLHV